MRTRLSGLVLLLTLLVLPVAAAGAAVAGPAEAADTVVATEAGEEAPGLEPRTADNLDNEFRPEGYEEPWTYWLGVFVLVSTVPVLALVGLLYYLLVHRHRDQAKAGAR
ncbi:MAG TPA: hypothetical protein VGA69_06230 [Nitriliruptorales bacterium]